MSAKVTIFIILVNVLAFALHLIIVKLLLDCVCEISKITTMLIKTAYKTDDGKQHFYYHTPDGDWIDLCGGDAATTSTDCKDYPNCKGCPIDASGGCDR